MDAYVFPYTRLNFRALAGIPYYQKAREYGERFQKCETVGALVWLNDRAKYRRGGPGYGKMEDRKSPRDIQSGGLFGCAYFAIAYV